MFSTLCILQCGKEGTRREQLCVKASVTISAEGNYLAYGIGGAGRRCPSEAGMMDWPRRFLVLSQEFPGRLKNFCQVPSLAQGNDLHTPL